MESLKAYVDLNLVSLVVSYAIIVGAAVVKLPQIFNVLRAGTAKGLSLPAVYLETVATLAGTIYNVLSGNPFRTYGETALILVQNLVIVVLIWSTTAKPSSGYVMFVTSAFVGIGAALWNVRQLEASWPQQLKDLNLTPLDSVQAFMTILYIVARVRPVPRFVNFAVTTRYYNASSMPAETLADILVHENRDDPDRRWCFGCCGDVAALPPPCRYLKSFKTSLKATRVCCQW